MEDSVEDDYENITRTEPAIQQDLLDIKVLEGVVRKDVEGLLDLYLVSARADVYPGHEATQALLQLFINNNDLESLNLLFRGSAENSEHRQLFYTESVSIQFQNIFKQWEIGKRLESWIQLVELYRSILSDRTEARISMSASEELVIKCRKIAKLFIEENIDTENSFLDAIRSGGLRVASEHRDIYILLALWEGLFFSNKFESQEKADKMFEEIPQLGKSKRKTITRKTGVFGVVIRKPEIMVGGEEYTPLVVIPVRVSKILLQFFPLKKRFGLQKSKYCAKLR